MEHSTVLQNIMRMSWEIQRKKKCTRGKALLSAWAILQNESTTIYYLVRRHSHTRHPNKVSPDTLSLFKP